MQYIKPVYESRPFTAQQQGRPARSQRHSSFGGFEGSANNDPPYPYSHQLAAAGVHLPRCRVRRAMYCITTRPSRAASASCAPGVTPLLYDASQLLKTSKGRLGKAGDRGAREDCAARRTSTGPRSHSTAHAGREIHVHAAGCRGIFRAEVRRLCQVAPTTLRSGR